MECLEIHLMVWTTSMQNGWLVQLTVFLMAQQHLQRLSRRSIQCETVVAMDWTDTQKKGDFIMTINCFVWFCFVGEHGGHNLGIGIALIIAFWVEQMLTIGFIGGHSILWTWEAQYKYGLLSDEQSRCAETCISVWVWVNFESFTEPSRATAAQSFLNWDWSSYTVWKRVPLNISMCFEHICCCYSRLLILISNH